MSKYAVEEAHPLDSITDSIYKWFKADKFPSEPPTWLQELIGTESHRDTKDLVDEARSLYKQYTKVIGQKQSQLNQGHNAWILKAGAKSRGRGIELFTNIVDLYSHIQKSYDSIWVAQKYIEKPLIIIRKKFDIRVWILVTSVRPLTVWMFLTPYLRFTAEDYDPCQIENKFMHLTNASINKKAHIKREHEVGQYKISDNMWESADFDNYLAQEYSTVKNALSDEVIPQIKQGVIDSLLAAQEIMNHRTRSHELFGYDFMVDEDLNVWLIEVNSSPSMEYSTPITKKLVMAMMPQIVRILLDHNHGEATSREVGDRIEEFELIRK